MTPLTAASAFDARRGQPGHFWVLKHSRACPSSLAACAEVASFERDHPGEPVLRVVVQDSPSVSEHVAQALGVPHETPQVLLIEDGRLAWHASHDEVSQAAMEMARLPAF